MIDTIIFGGEIVTADGVFEADVAIDDGVIAGIGAEDTFQSASERIDATNRLVMPGVVDPHVHLAGPNSIDTYEAGTAAAALGGVTTVCTFAWGSREDTDWSTLEAGIEYQQKEGEPAFVDFSCHAVITDEAIPGTELDAAIENGVPSFKLFTAYDFGVDNGGLEHAFERIAERDAVALVHTEDPDVCSRREAQQRTDGRSAPNEYPDSRPIHAEAMAADDAVRLAQETGVNYYGMHTSGEDSARAILTHRDDGSQIRAETCAHYLALDRSAYDTHGALAVMAPPLREPSDSDALTEHLRRGSLDVVSTDHVAFMREQKDAEAWWDAGFGINGLQRSLPVVHNEAVVRRGVSYPLLVRAMCTRPARTFGFESKGTLEVGTDADIIVFDPDKSQTITAESNASLADYTVYEGKKVQGAVETTLIRGTVVAADGEIQVDPGHGQFQQRTLPTWEAVQ